MERKCEIEYTHEKNKKKQSTIAIAIHYYIFSLFSLFKSNWILGSYPTNLESI